jgi:hypothetical protein
VSPHQRAEHERTANANGAGPPASYLLHAALDQPPPAGLPAV